MKYSQSSQSDPVTDDADDLIINREATSMWNQRNGEYVASKLLSQNWKIGWSMKKKVNVNDFETAFFCWRIYRVVP